MRKSVFFYYLKENKKYFLILVSVFLFSMIVGIYFVNHANELQINEIYNYVSSLKENIKSSDSINRTAILMKSLKHNIGFIILVWFLGCTLLGNFLIYVAIFYKGFSLGYTISAIIASLGIKNGTIFVIASLLLQNLIFLPMIFILSVSGINLYQNIKKNKFGNLKREFLKHMIILGFSIVVSIICSFIEVYISTNILIFFKNFL